MEHEQAERLISERVDGERIADRALVALERHLETCAECRAFERGAYRLREAVRFEVAPAVPDLVEPIMSAVRRVGDAGASRRGSLRLVRPGTGAPARRSRVLVPAIAATIVGTLVGTLVVGGPWGVDGHPGSRALAASDIARGVVGGASALDAYQARFSVTQWHLAPDDARDRLQMRVWFDAPERLRIDVTDWSDRATTSTDLRLIVDGDESYSRAPTACPTPVCPEREIHVRNRAPFSSSAPAPTDVVVPLEALGDADGVRVIGRAKILGRDAVEVEIPFERATSLFPFLALGGDWRPIYPADRVRVWLDQRDWFPLRWEVFPAAGEHRDAWALRFGLPHEPAGRPIFRVEATSVDLTPPSDAVFRIPDRGEVRDERADAVPVADLADRVGFTPVALADHAGLDLYRAVVPHGGDESLLSYADGVAFLKVGETRSWSDDAPFGPVGSRAQEVPLGDGVAYYEPATAAHGRRLAIHGAGTDLYVETNLPKGELLDIASSLPVQGVPMPREWRVRRTRDAIVERIDLADAEASMPFEVRLPPPPPGTALASLERITIGSHVGLTAYYRDDTSDLEIAAFRVHLEAARTLPPASSARQFELSIGVAPARWVPDRSLLEWVSDGVYHSIDGAGLTLERAVAIAETVAPDGSP